MDIKTVYYSHPKIMRGSAQEKEDTLFLQILGFTVESPYDPKYSDAWESEGIEFGRTLVEIYDAVAYRLTSDNRISAGVAKELKWAIELGKPIIEMPKAEIVEYSKKDIIERSMTIDETVEYFRTFKKGA